MSQQLINRSPDLCRLRDEGYDIEVRDGYLIVKDVPYVNARKEVKRGILISELTLSGETTTAPGTHVALFAGEYPCDKNGAELEKVRHQSISRAIARDLIANFSFSAKPQPGGVYGDFHHKMTTYAAILSGPAESIDPTITARTFPVIVAGRDESVFNYIDTASSRAGITAVTGKLEQIGRIGIIGVGGTGSYVLDLVAKTPVREIHLFDGDKFYNHNAFRSPGAPSVEELERRSPKAVFFRERYSAMHRGIVAHDYAINTSNVDELQNMDFVFLCLDKGKIKRLIVERLEAWGKSFIDVGIGVELDGQALGGVLRITCSTPEKREHIYENNRIPFSDEGPNNDYAQNIQIADLNSLNAALAVIKWKKLYGFYRDLENEHYSAYTIDGNAMVNEDQL